MAEACLGRFEFVEVAEPVKFRCEGHGVQPTAGGTEPAMAGNRKGL